ncbi:MAG: hypothetical protein J5691_01515 [Bacilli bacterium]|nr:hypothetical protein [Bacilli bacterium]
MADFNQIFVESSLLIQSKPIATLGFNDGLAISKSKYALENHMLTLNVNTTESVSIFYNNGIANTYEFSVKLNKAGVELPPYDLADKPFNNLTNKYILVFVNGELQPADAYTIANNTLSFNYAYTNDINRFFEVIVYVSSVSFIRTVYSAQEISQIDLDNIELTLTYSAQNTAIFINGEKVSFLAVEKIIPDGAHADAIKLNIPNIEISSFEIIKFETGNTDAINFVTESGYLTYGPYDDYSKKIPILYDTVVTFNDQAKVLIDNLRPGFIIRETDAYGQLIIVDDTFESQELKCITAQKFRYSSYQKDKYYLEVPSYTSITKYLAEYDNKYTFIPEILLIFQRMLLDELNDSIQRLRDMRNIHKVDSVNIDNLLKLLGFNANIKTLNVKQRRELLEELNEFHRVVGTRYSYNLVNILQNNLKLINMEQLFTPYGLQDKTKKTVYNYASTLVRPGTGYAVNDYLKAADGYISILVDGVDEETGAITSYIQQNSDGYVALAGEYPLVGGLEGYFNITSPTNQYRYNWTISNDIDCHAGQELQTSGGTYSLRVTGDDGAGHITSFIPSIETGNVAITDIIDSKLYLVTSNMQLKGKISSTDVTSSPDNYELIYDLSQGIGENLSLGPGKYFVKLSGGGGSGSCAGSTSATGQTSGYAGEAKSYEFTLTEDSIVTYYVGEGGGKVYAKGMTTDAVQAGNGYEQGEMGQIVTSTTTQTTAVSSGVNTQASTARTASRRIGTGTSVAAVSQVSVSNVGGQGGGSSALVTPTGTFIAKGGNGGNATNEIFGGQGGNGGTTSGTGNQGGTSTIQEWSENGSNGYVKIYRIKQNYSFEIDPQSDTSHVPNGQTFNLTTPYIDFEVTANTTTDPISFTITPTQGYPIINTGYLLMAANSNTSAYLTIESIPSAYIYQVQLETDHTMLKPNMVFTGTASEGTNFTYKVTEVNNETGVINGEITPNTGPNAINESYVTATYQTGTGGKLKIESTVNSQKNMDRCYIDFYTRAELVDESKGEGLVSYYKEDTIDYMTITEGTPHSPQFWVTGDPDIDYGPIADTLEITEAAYDYGYITEDVGGEWVEYWNWERGSIWYPTNHVDLEMKIPVGVDISSYVNTFIEQFYNIASTVVFIHSIIESFYFGNEGDTNASEGNYNGMPIKIPADARPTFGIATGAPISREEIIVTSNPHIQYMKPTYYFGWASSNDVCYTVFSTPSVNDYVYKKVNNDFVFDGIVVSVVTELVAQSNNQPAKHRTIIYYKNTEGEISAGFKRASEYDEPIQQKCTLTIISTPSDAQIRIASTSGFLLAQGTGSLSYTAPYGTEIIWSVRAGSNYISRAQRRTLEKDATKYIILEKVNAY